MNKLLPCPFCGGEATVVLDDKEHQCVCSGCFAQTSYWRFDRELAVNEWNTRVIDGHVVTFYWDEPGVVGPNWTWCVVKGCWMYGPCDTWQEVEEDIRTGWEHGRNLVGR